MTEQGAQAQTLADGWYKLTGGDETEVYVAMCRNGYMTDFGFAYMLPESGWAIEPIVIVPTSEAERMQATLAMKDEAISVLDNHVADLEKRIAELEAQLAEANRLIQELTSDDE